MRVILMPVNTASIAYTTVKSLRENQVDAYGLMFETNVIQSFSNLQTVRIGNKKKPHQTLLGILKFGYYLTKFVREGKPDVIHWYYSGSASTLNMDIHLLKALNVPGIVEWAGSDIRIPELEFAENPYYTEVFDKGYEYARFESRKDSLSRQQRFADIGFASVAATGMMQYIQRGIAPKVFKLEQRLNLADFEAQYPRVDNPRPLVIHSPTAKNTKGTDAVLKAIETLQSRYRFDFRLITGMPRSEALKLIQQADIFLDQFVLGDRGLASLEAMAFGKPVICYIKPSLVQAYPSDLPIVNATKITLVDALEDLVCNSKKRNELGQASRIFVERYHDASKIIPQLIAIYRSISPGLDIA